jgi:hypothetical protein
MLYSFPTHVWYKSGTANSPSLNHTNNIQLKLIFTENTASLNKLCTCRPRSAGLFYTNDEKHAASVFRIQGRMKQQRRRSPRNFKSPWKPQILHDEYQSYNTEMVRVFPYLSTTSRNRMKWIPSPLISLGQDTGKHGCEVPAKNRSPVVCVRLQAWWRCSSGFSRRVHSSVDANVSKKHSVANFGLETR